MHLRIIKEHQIDQNVYERWISDTFSDIHKYHYLEQNQKFMEIVRSGSVDVFFHIVKGDKMQFKKNFGNNVLELPRFIACCLF